MCLTGPAWERFGPTAVAKRRNGLARRDYQELRRNCHMGRDCKFCWSTHGTLLLPSIMAAAHSGNLSIGGVSQAIAGGAGGAILTALIGAIKNSTSRTVTVARINTRHASLGRPRMSNGPNSEHPARARRPRLVRSHRVVTRMRASATEGAGVELESSCARRALSSWVEAVRIRWP